jgi:hypothetical protein
MRFIWILVLLLCGLTRAQTESPAKRILGSAIIKGFVGGESHDAYVIQAKQGQMLKMYFTWKPESNNSASFSISQSASFFTANPVSFGRFSSNQRRWVGKIPKSTNYYIFVVAHPTAAYTLWLKLL